MCVPQGLTKVARLVKWLEGMALYLCVITLLTAAAVLLDGHLFETPSWFFVAGILFKEYDYYRSGF